MGLFRKIQWWIRPHPTLGHQRPINVLIERVWLACKVAIFLSTVAVGALHGVKFALVFFVVCIPVGSIVRTSMYDLELWYRSTKCFGGVFKIPYWFILKYQIPSSSGRRQVAQVLLAIFGLFLVMNSDFVLRSPLLYPALLGFITYIFVCTLYLFAPPVILVLGQSGTNAIDLHALISYQLRGIRAVALTEMGDYNYGIRDSNFRLSESSDWRRVIVEYMNIVKIIVIDVRSVTRHVLTEVELAIQNNHYTKVLFVVRDSGEHPDLTSVIDNVRRVEAKEIDVRMIKESDLVCALKVIIEPTIIHRAE